MHDSLLAPLGMDHSSFDQAVIRSTRDRAVGHVDPYPTRRSTCRWRRPAACTRVPRTLPGSSTSSSATARSTGGSSWAAQMAAMRTVPAPHAGAPAGYALGVVRHRWNRWDQRPTLFDHGGGGFGFLSDLWWLPSLQIGIAVLTNSQDHRLQGDLALSVLGDLVEEPGVYRDRLLALPSRPPVG